MREPPGFGQIKLGLLAFLYIEVDPYPIEQRSVARSNWLGATEKPSVSSLSVTHSEIQLTPSARSEAG
jgi:hypothetical protein